MTEFGHLGMKDYWGCVSIDNKPLGYVSAFTHEEAVAAGKARWPDLFKCCHLWEGVL